MAGKRVIKQANLTIDLRLTWKPANLFPKAPTIEHNIPGLNLTRYFCYTTFLVFLYPLISCHFLLIQLSNKSIQFPKNHFKRMKHLHTSLVVLSQKFCYKDCWNMKVQIHALIHLTSRANIYKTALPTTVNLWVTALHHKIPKRIHTNHQTPHKWHIMKLLILKLH